MCDFAAGLSRQINGSVIPSERKDDLEPGFCGTTQLCVLENIVIIQSIAMMIFKQSAGSDYNFTDVQVQTMSCLRFAPLSYYDRLCSISSLIKLGVEMLGCSHFSL